MKKKLKILAIIPARSGSKRLPNKNILNFKNKPLIYWTIKSAYKSKIFNKIIFSSDSKKYIQIAKKFGSIHNRLRPKSISNHKSKPYEYVKDILQIEKEDYNIICILQPTSPLRTEKHIFNAYNQFQKGNKKTLISVTKINRFTNKKYIHSLSKKKNFFKKNIVINGGIYMFKNSFFKKYNKCYSNQPMLYFMDNKNSIDIDYYEDFKVAAKKI